MQSSKSSSDGPLSVGEPKTEQDYNSLLGELLTIRDAAQAVVSTATPCLDGKPMNVNETLEFLTALAVLINDASLLEPFIKGAMKFYYRLGHETGMLNGKLQEVLDELGPELLADD